MRGGVSSGSATRFGIASISARPWSLCCLGSARTSHGLLYAKSHCSRLSQRHPGRFCYQRLSIDGAGPPFCLHGFNAVLLPAHGWYRIDARGNKTGVDAQFTPMIEHLAFPIQYPGETTLPEIHAEPLAVVVETLRSGRRLPKFARICRTGGPRNSPASRWCAASEEYWQQARRIFPGKKPPLTRFGTRLYSPPRHDERHMGGLQGQVVVDANRGC